MGKYWLPLNIPSTNGPSAQPFFYFPFFQLLFFLDGGPEALRIFSARLCDFYTLKRRKIYWSMADTIKGPTTAHTQLPSHSVEPRKVELLTGWKYKSQKFGPFTLPWYASPESQLILVSFVCFLCPGKASWLQVLFPSDWLCEGMFNALNGLGGAGQLSKNAYASDASNSAL